MNNINKMERTRVWTGHAKIEKGIRHERRGMKCQDYVEMEKRDNKISISLLDGRGDTDVNAQAVKSIAKILNDFMICFFDEICTMDDKIIAYNLMLQIERKMGELSEEYGVNYEELASTLLAFCIDEQQKKYCAVHLGDGVIAVKDNSETIELLSLPLNGMSRNQTILTTSEKVLEYFKIYRGNIDEIKGVMLVSDGIYDGKEDFEYLMRCFSEKKSDGILKKKIDDQSMIMMYV